MNVATSITVTELTELGTKSKTPEAESELEIDPPQAEVARATNRTKLKPR